MVEGVILMTDEEFAQKLPDVSLTAIASGLLKLEAERESALDKAIKDLETDSLKLSDEDRRKRFGARLRTVRQLRGLTQAGLAKEIGISKQAITTYETGRREAGYRNLIALSRALEVSIDWLLK